MRRALSILLVIFFGLGPLTAILPASEDARLPACCRRNGAHHCAMQARMASDTTPGFTAPATCPNYPGVMATLMTPADALVPSAPLLPVLFARADTPAVGCAAAIENPILPHAARGPPVDLLS